jgi:hypothetical protein
MQHCYTLGRQAVKTWLTPFISVHVYGELLFRQATWRATLLHPFLYVIDSKRALSFGEAQLNIFMRTAPKRLCAFLLPNETKSAEVLPAVPPGNYH